MSPSTRPSRGDRWRRSPATDGRGRRPPRRIADQLALRNNRPDLLLEHMHLGTPEIVAHFRARHARRLAQRHLDDATLARQFADAPTAAIVRVETKGKHADVAFELAARGGDLRGYTIYVNGVPARSVSRTERVELVARPNWIDIVAVDAGGAESQRASATATYAGAATGDLYYIGFGVSQYRNPARRRFRTAHAPIATGRGLGSRALQRVATPKSPARAPARTFLLDRDRRADR